MKTPTYSAHGQRLVSESEPFCDPSSPGVQFLPLLLVLHELLLHLFHGALRRHLILLREDVGERECLALGLRCTEREREREMRKTTELPPQ